ncbi:hypothetical protein U1Q18_008632 [Sarracenia purpurea var. burkii]
MLLSKRNANSRPVWKVGTSIVVEQGLCDRRPLRKPGGSHVTLENCFALDGPEGDGQLTLLWRKLMMDVLGLEEKLQWENAPPTETTREDRLTEEVVSAVPVAEKELPPVPEPVSEETQKKAAAVVEEGVEAPQ